MILGYQQIFLYFCIENERFSTACPKLANQRQRAEKTHKGENQTLFKERGSYCHPPDFQLLDWRLQKVSIWLDVNWPNYYVQQKHLNKKTTNKVEASYTLAAMLWCAGLSAEGMPMNRHHWRHDRQHTAANKGRTLYQRSCTSPTNQKGIIMEFLGIGQKKQNQ